jgi:N-acetylglucosaminyldiphosphoundecaprenol N-acetyl-beta-D-mannosaminyltransferase
MKKIIITSGYFNPMHPGHINLFREAKGLGDFLIVIINNDEQTRSKGSTEFMNENDRSEIVKSVKYVDEVFLSVDKGKSISESLKEIALKFPGCQLFFAKGGDRNAGNIPEEERRICKEFNIQIVNGVGGDKIQSSSWLINNIVNKFFSIKVMENKINKIKSIEVLGNKIDMVQMSDVIELMDHWIKNEGQKTHWIVATGMHGVVESKRRKEFGEMLKSADLWVCDGISLVWLARLNGFNLKKRVAGPDLFHEFLKFSDLKGYKHYFYGDTDGTLGKLKEKLSRNLLGIKMESFSPPFRKLTAEEDEEIIKKINNARPDVLWVGLGLPKQETWIFEHREKLKVPVIVGVGAAFKFEAGEVRRAPSWVGNLGFEWLWRLFQEPKRVWRRVFIDAPQFIWLALIEFIKKPKNKKL